MSKINKKDFLPYAKQSIDDDDIEAVISVLKSDFLTTGPVVTEFEDMFSEVLNVPHAVSCSSGSAALHLAYLSLDLGPGNYVVIPSVTFLATANMVLHTGAEIIFCDVDPKTGLASAETIREAIEFEGERVSVITVVHMAGQISDMQSISKLALELDVQVIEDACHALGSLDPSGDPVGRCSNSAATIFSLHPVKAIAGGEGGVITTRDAEIACSMRRIQNHGMIRQNFTDLNQALSENGQVNPWYYEMLNPGFNYRLSDIHAALAKQQLTKLKHFTEHRSSLVKRYDAVISTMPDNFRSFIRPSGRASCGEVAWHLYIVLIDFKGLGCDRSTVMQYLKSKGIGTQVHYLPLHMQPYYRKRYGKKYLPGAEDWYAQTLSLPLHVGMEYEDVDRVISVLSEALVKCR